MPARNFSKRQFDSSLGSDTGTSTRESECSEEQQHSPVDRPVHLYDSLAAELRAKLNGSGPPLLLPPRDYDTISRSQGNLTAVDLRRCQNLSIVGKDIKGVKKRGHVSSHGSSGIGSDLAPSPERQEEISNSSSDDWKNDINDRPSSSFIRKMEKTHISDEKMSPTRYRENPPSYIFPKEPLNDYKVTKKPQQRIEADMPIIMKKQIGREMIKSNHIEPLKASKDDRKHHGGLMRQQSERYRQATDRIEYTRSDRGKYDQGFERDHYERENLTDRQKYREIVENKRYRDPHDSQCTTRVEMHRLNDYKKDEFSSDHHIRTIQRKPKATERFNSREPLISDRVERNPYREPDSLPYLESMMKSPVMRYKSKTAYERRSPSPSEEMYLHAQRSGRTRRTDQDREHYVKDSSPMSTMKKTSPKDRFQDAKEKFQAMDKIRLKEAKSVRRSEPMRYEKDYRQEYSPEPRSYHQRNDWSSEEELPMKTRDYRDMHQSTDRDLRGMGPAKSLGNLVNVKGYRHSYAENKNASYGEPMKYCNRVGLAAIEHY